MRNKLTVKLFILVSLLLFPIVAHATPSLTSSDFVVMGVVLIVPLMALVYFIHRSIVSNFFKSGSKNFIYWCELLLFVVTEVMLMILLYMPISDYLKESMKKGSF